MEKEYKEKDDVIKDILSKTIPLEELLPLELRVVYLSKKEEKEVIKYPVVNSSIELPKVVWEYIKNIKEDDLEVLKKGLEFQGENCWYSIFRCNKNNTEREILVGILIDKKFSDRTERTYYVFDYNSETLVYVDSYPIEEKEKNIEQSLIFILSCFLLFFYELALGPKDLTFVLIEFSVRFICYCLTIAIISGLISLIFRKDFHKIFVWLFFIAVMFDYLRLIILIINKIIMSFLY